MISADDLRFFLEVSRTGKLVAAARGLGVDHTTVGRRITQLEKASGARLFVRVPGGWELTEAGERLAIHAEAVESSLLAAAEELGSSAGRLSGTLRIAAPDGFGAFVLSPGLGNLRARYPDLKVEIVTATRLNLLASKEFDVGISLARPTIRGVESFELAEYPLGLYASAQYLQRHGPISNVDELLKHSVIGYVDSLLDIPALRFLDAALPGVRPAIQTNNITGQWMAAVAGLGVAVLPFFIAEPDSRLVHILDKSVAIRRKYWLAVPRELQRLARIRAAHQELMELVLAHPYLEVTSSIPH
ncbi:LysR family transcriptional regulator [Pseudarthrobacter sp. MDT3-26]|uniref:LysR family transcriptional regulator n=1 Tax=Pseudarthrobacter raffinosi TaxID=2953651 RepID=UPI00208FD56C|nr:MULTISPECIES: LysR family transcriptional regulator [unclassified Pseudarthrobacter]MCO4238881.1 LysR family transcriptional regulator [Pseudarthrobacter sp. MDT3-28]MCO4264837.1 LysR family transcriptional regulator [Pseudarthrobacter sp. MDT3-26]